MTNKDACPHYNEDESLCCPCGLACEPDTAMCFAAGRASDMMVAMNYVANSKKPFRDHYAFDTNFGIVSHMLWVDMKSKVVYVAQADCDDTVTTKRPVVVPFDDIMAIYHAHTCKVIYFVQ